MTVYYGTLCVALVVSLMRDIECLARHLNNMGYTNRWVVHMEDGPVEALRLATEHDLIYQGQLGSLKDFYYLSHKDSSGLAAMDEGGYVVSETPDAHRHRVFSSHPKIRWFEQQTVKQRFKRGYFTDPLFKKQWYLSNEQFYEHKGQVCKHMSGVRVHDINVLPAWQANITGNGVVVTILDDGVEHSHPDLQKNFDFNASYDINSNDTDPMPRYTDDNINNHGTRCAGEVAAQHNNKKCGVGVAFNAKLGGIRMLDGKITDGVEAESLGFKPDYIDIYSVSWGPSDDGKTVDGPGRAALKSIRQGIKYGRRNLGSIYIWATGNGGRYGDHCSCDGYINSPYTISIGAVDICGRHPWYGEECAGTLAVTYGSKSYGYHNAEITTTDLHAKCTSRHTGSSAAAPLAAGIFALVLEANPRLTWRDVQHLVVHTSKQVSPRDQGWVRNKAGHRINAKFGFGALDTGALIERASSVHWRTADPQRICTTKRRLARQTLRKKGAIQSKLTTTGCYNLKNCVTKLEHVQVVVKLVKQRYRGRLDITLISPSGTRSPILKNRFRDLSDDGFNNWEFLTVFHWGEEPAGEWRLIVRDYSSSYGKLVHWHLRFFGTCHRPPLWHKNPMKMRAAAQKHTGEDSDLKSKVHEAKIEPPSSSTFLIGFTIITLVALIVLAAKYRSSLVSCARHVRSHANDGSRARRQCDVTVTSSRERTRTTTGVEGEEETMI